MSEVIRIEGAAVPEEGHAVRVVVSGNPVAVFRVAGTLYALDARCTHVGGPLDGGTVGGLPCDLSVAPLRFRPPRWECGTGACGSTRSRVPCPPRWGDARS